MKFSVSLVMNFGFTEMGQKPEKNVHVVRDTSTCTAFDGQRQIQIETLAYLTTRVRTSHTVVYINKTALHTVRTT